MAGREARLQQKWSEVFERAKGNGMLFGPDGLKTTSEELDKLDLPWAELANKCTLVNLYGSQLTEIPEQLRDFSKLEILNLGKNKISSVPEWIASMPTLKTLHVHENPVSHLHPRLGHSQGLVEIGLYKSGPLRKDKELWTAYESGEQMHACSRNAIALLQLLRSRYGEDATREEGPPDGEEGPPDGAAKKAAIVSKPGAAKGGKGGGGGGKGGGGRNSSATAPKAPIRKSSRRR